MSLIATIVSLGIGTTVAVGIGQTMSFSFRAQKHIELTSDKEVIKRTILGRSSCELSLPAGDCSVDPGKVTELRMYDHLGELKTFVSSDSDNPTKMGSWTLRAECNATGDGIVVRAARLAANGSLTSTSEDDFIADPLTGKVVTWNDDASLLFPSGSELCSGKAKQIVEVFGSMKYLGHSSGCGGLDRQQGNKNPKFWAGSAHCPVGYTAIAGSDLRTEEMRLVHTNGGYDVQGSFQMPTNARTWRMAFCAYTRPDVAKDTTVDNAFKVICLRNE